MTTNKSITYRSSNDWGCEHTDADNDRWLAFVEIRLEAAYPGAKVSVESTDDTDSSAEAHGLDVHEEEIRQFVGNDLWEEFCADNFGRPNTPAQHGIDDARTFASEHPEDVAGALEPGQLGADESLINAMGSEATAKLFGVEPGTEAFSAACESYNKAFDAELKKVARGEEYRAFVAREKSIEAQINEAADADLALLNKEG